MTAEPQYDLIVDKAEREGLETLGLMTSYAWADDPKRLGFTLARYKFVAKMFSGFGSVLEIGCGDAFASRVVAQEVGSVTAIDVDERFIADARRRMRKDWRVECLIHDMLAGPMAGRFEGIYALDVLEHIEPRNERAFLENALNSLDADGAAIFGMPSLESQRHASKLSRQGHVNCKSGPGLKTTLRQYFRHVFLFTMHDETLGTGYLPMAHYLLALCCGPRDSC